MTKVLPPVGAVKGVALPIVFLSIDGLGTRVTQKFPQEEQWPVAGGQFPVALGMELPRNAAPRGLKPPFVEALTRP